MRVSIHFCARCDYEPRAVRLAAEVRAHFSDAEIELIPAGDGVFEVKCGDTLIYDMGKTGHLPESAEVLEPLVRGLPDAER
jgi:selT/selW/selH-like putative selenoprotein